MNNQKGLAPIIIILVLTVIIGGGVFAWQKFGTPKQELKQESKDETANWKTYTNDEYGFEFKYPKDFFSPHHQLKTEIIQCDYDNLANNCSTEMISINDKPFCLEKKDGAAAGTKYTTYNYTTVIDKECFIVSFTVPYPNCSNLPDDEEAYNKCKLDNEITKPEIINKILSTFKFTSTSTDEKTNWETYRNEEYRFEIKYPKIWGDVKTEKPSWADHAEKVITFISSIVPSDPNLYAKEPTEESLGIGYTNITISVYDYDNPQNLSIKEIFKGLNQSGGISYSDLDDMCIMDYKFIDSTKGTKNTVILATAILAGGPPPGYYVDASKAFKTMTIDGKEALRRPLNAGACPPGAGTGDHVYFSRYNQIYRISMSWEPTREGSISQWISIFNQMLSTFKFLE